MKALGIDIGTTTISAVVMDMDTQKVEKAYTISNNSFLDAGHVWERLQDPAVIIAKAKNLVDSILEEYPEIARIGLTGQMHGFVYIDEKGRSSSGSSEIRRTCGNPLTNLTPFVIMEHSERL